MLPHNPFSRRNLPARDADEITPVDVDWVSGACMLVRRDAFAAVGGMDEGFFLYWEDADFCRRLQQAGWRTAYVPQAAAMHIGGRSSRHAADASLEAFHRSAYRLYNKHASAPGRLLSPLVFAGLQMRLALMKRLVRRRSAGRGGLAAVSDVVLGASGWSAASLVAIRISSSRCPSLRAATSQRGCLPRPDHVSDGVRGLRNFGWTF